MLFRISRKSNFEQIRKCIFVLTCNLEKIKMTKMQENPTFSKHIDYLNYLLNALLSQTTYLNNLLHKIIFNFYKCMYREIKKLSNVSLMLSFLIDWMLRVKTWK